MNNYPKNLVGGKMRDRIFTPLIKPEQTIKEVREYLEREMKNLETINYLYVLDKNDKLLGVVTIKELFRNLPEIKIADIFKKEIITVQPDVEAEEVAQLALKNNLKAIPVVDKKNNFLGILTSDKILNILNKDFQKKLLHFGGFYHKETFKYENTLETPFFVSIKHRLPWLLIGLLGGIFAAKVIGFFENVLEKNIILAMFLPLVVYISNAIGTQLQTLFVRDLSVLNSFPLRKYFRKQFFITLVIIFLCALFLFMIISVFWQNVFLAFILGLAILYTSLAAAFISILIPFILKKSKFDPALGSGPFATIIQDILTVVIYFGICSVLL